MTRSALFAVIATFVLGACDKSDSDGANSFASNAKTSDQPGPPFIQPPQLRLARMFSNASTVLLSVNASDGFEEIKPAHDVSLGLKGNELKIKAVGADPSILLPKFPGDDAIAELIMESPSDSTVQLFYRQPGMVSFTESYSIRVPIKAGRNVVYFQLPAWAGVLRLDPGQVPGDYLLESFQVRRALSHRIP